MLTNASHLYKCIAFVIGAEEGEGSTQTKVIHRFIHTLCITMWIRRPLRGAPPYASTSSSTGSAVMYCIALLALALALKIRLLSFFSAPNQFLM